MDYYAINGMAMAFVAGLVASPHCVGMCGPLGCALIPMGSAQSSSQLALGVYHLSRVIAYGLVGLLAGAVGNLAWTTFTSVPMRILPWIFVAVFLLAALRLHRFFPKPKGWQRFYFRLTARLKKLPKPVLGIGLGLATPLLPCGPLYFIFMLTLLSGNALKGAEIGAGFAVGTLPLLWLAQSQYLRFSPKMPARLVPWLQSSLAIMAAALITWRMTSGNNAFDAFFCH